MIFIKITNGRVYLTQSNGRTKDMNVKLEQLKNIITDLKNDDEWVNDSLTQAEHKGLCDGLNRLLKHITETKED